MGWLSDLSGRGWLTATVAPTATAGSARIAPFGNRVATHRTDVLCDFVTAHNEMSTADPRRRASRR